MCLYVGNNVNLLMDFDTANTVYTVKIEAYNNPLLRQLKAVTI